MKVFLLEEPDLEFANGSRHTDPRHGIAFYGPADTNLTAPRTIRLGIIGTREAIDGVKRWLDKCRGPIAAKASHLTGLFVSFPGFDTNAGFRSTIVWDTRLERQVAAHALRNVETLNPLEAVKVAIDLYDIELAALNEEPSCDVVLICRPDVLPEHVVKLGNADRPWAEPRVELAGVDFHSLLKAKSLKTSRPIQIIRRETCVKGHWFLPGGGHETCPVAVTSFARWWPWDLPWGAVGHHTVAVVVSARGSPPGR